MLSIVNNISVNQFRDKLRYFVEQVIHQHQPLKVTRRNGEDFVVISAEDWEREQETLYILQNPSLMKQVSESQLTHQQSQGFKPTQDQLNEIFDI